MKRILNFIDGKWVEPIGKKYFDNINPAKGEVYSVIPDSDASDIAQAVVAAKNAFPAWSKTNINHRYRVLSRIADLIEENLDDLALAESVDNGKPLKLARTIDIPRASANFRFFATAITQFASEAHSMEQMAINYTLRQPLGVVACISPWNLPLYLFTWKIAPALAAGNSVVAKPSEITPMTAHLLTEICMEAGLPKGVLNIVHGYGHKAGEALITHQDVKAISFTGGTKTGSRIASLAAPVFKKLSLELGGKNPNIIFADCDYDVMLKTTMRSSFANQGQICLCGSRILVEETIFEKFKKDFVEKTKQLRIAPPLSDTSQIGAVVSEAHMEKILTYVELAKSEGGKILTGGKRVILEGENSKGYYLEPTIIEGLDQSCRTNQEEIFGPVVTIQPFKNESEALILANSTPYGLSSTIWTENLTRAHRMASEIQAGIVWINCWLMRDLRTPFGGVKASGVGREGGFEALRFFTEAKNVCIKYGDG
jgi:aminomuconate-semialdehyde/2-hydroxymuconate-6-semialdehyde dehydrogenase